MDEQMIADIAKAIKARGIEDWNVGPLTDDDVMGLATAAHSVMAGKVAELTDENARLREALTPSGATKAEYIGEFSFTIDEQSDGAMCEVSRKITVPWTTTKEIMAAIRERAALAPHPKGME